MTTDKATVRLQAKINWERDNDRAFLGIDEHGQDLDRLPTPLTAAERTRHIQGAVRDTVKHLSKAAEIITVAIDSHPGRLPERTPSEHDEWINLRDAELEIKKIAQFLGDM